MCMPMGKSIICTPSTQWHADSYELEVRDGKDDGWQYVDAQTYRAYPDGSYIDFRH